MVTNPSIYIKKCTDVNSVNQTHPDTFTHIQHDVSLRFSFVVHPTSSDKHHCQEHHRHSIIVSAQDMCRTFYVSTECTENSHRTICTQSNHHQCRRDAKCQRIAFLLAVDATFMSCGQRQTLGVTIKEKEFHSFSRTVTVLRLCWS